MTWFKPIPLGTVFGRLTVIGDAPNRGRIGKHWLCRCECGQLAEVGGGPLRSKSTLSCGCLRNDNRRKAWAVSRTHGHCVDDKQSKTYFSWRAMLQRCCNPKHKEFHRYGAQGIAPCKAWRDSFAAFLNDMGECPRGKTLDRIDNRFGYFLANCRWSTPKQQAANRRERAA